MTCQVRTKENPVLNKVYSSYLEIWFQTHTKNTKLQRDSEITQTWAHCGHKAACQHVLCVVLLTQLYVSYRIGPSAVRSSKKQPAMGEVGLTDCDFVSRNIPVSIFFFPPTCGFQNQMQHTAEQQFSPSIQHYSIGRIKDAYHPQHSVSPSSQISWRTAEWERETRDIDHLAFFHCWHSREAETAEWVSESVERAKRWK